MLKVFRRRQKHYSTTNGAWVTRRKRTSMAARCEDPRVAAFMRWCGQVGIRLHPKIRIGRRGSCAEIGVVATEEIAEGEMIAYIPRAALLTCANSAAVRRRLLQDDVIAEDLDNVSSWVPLLVAMLAEYGQESSSRWYPYLQLVPNYGSAGPPMLWSQSQRDTLLAGTSVVQLVHTDMENISHDFKTIVLPFMQRHPDLFRPHLHTQDLYEHMVSMVMSYSFSDGSNPDLLQRTVMVPFVDLLNHHSHHHVELTFMEDHLELVAIRTIKKGEEVMNTYGPLPNASLMHKYGFAELQNPHDVGYITHHILNERVLGHGSPTVMSRWRQLKREGLTDEDMLYCVNRNGHPEMKLLLTVKMLHKGKLHFACLRQQLIKELAKDEDDTERVKGVKSCELSTLSSQETVFLTSLVQQALEELPATCYEYGQCHGLWTSDRERFASYLCRGQQTCLKALLDNI